MGAAAGAGVAEATTWAETGATCADDCTFDLDHQILLDPGGRSGESSAFLFDGGCLLDFCDFHT